MIKLPEAFLCKYDVWLRTQQVPAERHAEYRKWLRFYLDFCTKYSHHYLQQESLGCFADELKSKGQSLDQLAVASQAVMLYIGMATDSVDCVPPENAANPVTLSKVVLTEPVTGSSWMDELAKLEDEIQLGR